MNTKEFLTEYFSTKSDESFICIWESKNKRSKFFTDPDQAADYADLIKDKANVYHGCGLLSRDLGPKRRGGKPDVCEAPGLWLDIDLKSSKKPMGIPDLETAMGLIESLPVQYTMAVNSGNGMHVYYLFKEAWQLPDDVKRAKFEEKNKLLLSAVQMRAKENGWEIDSVCDCTRVLRPPGTFNFKDPKNPKSVKILNNSGPRYADPQKDFDILKDLACRVTLPAAPALTISAADKSKVAGGLTFESNANPPADKMLELSEVHEMFKPTWNNARGNTINDKSPSAYAQSLAIMALQVGWDDQEVTNLIIAFYKKHDHDLFKKHNPADFIPRTILRAKNFIQEHQANDALEDLSLRDGTHYEQDEAIKKEQARKILKAKLKLDVIKIVKYVRENPSYEVHTSNGVVFLKQTNDLIKFSRFRERVFDQIEIYITYNDNKNWPKIVAAFKTLFERKENPEERFDGKMKKYLRNYLFDKDATHLKYWWDRGDYPTEPFVYGRPAQWHLRAKWFRRYLYHIEWRFRSIEEITLIFARLGCTNNKPVNLKLNRTHFDRGDNEIKKYVQKTSKRYWRVPKEIIQPRKVSN
jgi:hypothetical protein